MKFYAQATDPTATPAGTNWQLYALLALAVIAIFAGIFAYANRRRGLRSWHGGVAGEKGTPGTAGTAGNPIPWEEFDGAPRAPRTKF